MGIVSFYKKFLRSRPILWIRSHYPLIFLGLSLVLVMVAIALGIVAQKHDSKWNEKVTSEYLSEFEIETMKDGNQTFSKEELDMAYRDTWMKMAFFAISGFLLVSTIIHMIIYSVYNEEHYRYNFTLMFTMIAMLLYFAAGGFIISSTIINNDHYTDIYQLAANKGIIGIPNHNTTQNTTQNVDLVLVPLFRLCPFSSGEESAEETVEEDNVQLNETVLEKRKTVFSDGICQLSTLKFAAGGLALCNILVLCGVLLSTHSKTSEEEDELNNIMDLDYDPNDVTWTEPLSSWKQGEPRTRAELEELGLASQEDESTEYSESESVLTAII